ncbi:MAG: hypothetical protein M1834_006582 [Cirrosporium novae-zelandiae]|nr:MAG: hypothetical protein M1834_006582 [Cirrosporium novae-zelandiae]
MEDDYRNRKPASEAVHESLISSPTSKGLDENQTFEDHDDKKGESDRNSSILEFMSGASILREWWFEILSLGVLFIALAAIVLTLSTQQGRPLPHWPYKVSVNTLVSVYALVLKAAMLLIVTEGLSQLKWAWYSRSRPLEDISKFDIASRSPWGAIQLLWTLRGRHLVATIGALVMIVSLIIDPVAQLLVRYYSCNIQLPNISANIPRRNTFSEMGLHVSAGVSTLTYEFQSAINAGLFNPESVNIPFACPTGNCTFNQEYHTIAFCSSCSDLTPNLTVSCNPHSYIYSYINGSSPSANVVNETEPGWQCNATLPSGYSAVTNTFLDAGIEYLRTYGPEDYSTNVTMVAANLTDVYAGNVGNCTTAAENATWSCSGYGAATCTLSPCIKSYRATVKEAVLKEEFLTSSSEWEYDGDSYAIASIDVECLSRRERQALIEIGYNINDTTKWIGYRGSGYFGNATDETKSSNNVPNVTVPAKCLYEVYTPSIMSLGNFMGSFFNGSVTNDPNWYYSYVTAGPVQLQKFFDTGNISFESINTTFSDIADSMTAYLRQSAKPGNTGFLSLEKGDTTPAAGQVYRVETCINVRWWYIALPVVLVILTVLFLVAMLAEARNHNRGDDWKSSTLALIFHGLDSETRHQFGELERTEEMTRAAQQMRVQLQKTDHGWAFVKTD